MEVGGDHLGHLRAFVGECGAKVRGGPQVPGLALGSGQGVIGDGSDERLGEDVLAAFGRELVGPDRQHLFSHKGTQQLLEQGTGSRSETASTALAREARAEHRALLYETALVWGEGVEARRDEGRQPRWDLEFAELADELEGAVARLLDDALVEKAPHGLDRIERDAVGAFHDLCSRWLGQVGDEAVQELAHDLVRERVERKGRHRSAGEHEALALDRPPVATARARRWRGRPTIRGGGPRSRACRGRPTAGPRSTMTTGQVLGQPLEEQSPAREELFSREHLGSRQSQELAEAGGDELPVGSIFDPALEAGPHPLGDDFLWVLLADLQPCADHLRQRPVADALPVGKTAPGVPEHGSGQAVDVLFELPGEARLADAGDTRDEHHARRAALG